MAVPVAYPAAISLSLQRPLAMLDRQLLEDDRGGGGGGELAW